MSIAEREAARDCLGQQATSDLEPKIIFTHACNTIPRGEQRQFFRTLGVSTKHLNKWIDIPQELAYLTIEEHLVNDPREKYRFLKKCSHIMKAAMQEELQSCNYQPHNDDLPPYIYRFLEIHATSRKDCFRDFGIPIRDHPLQTCYDLAQSEFKGVLRRWYTERGENPEDLQKLLSGVEQYEKQTQFKC